ncbi:hypothetical protein RIF23_13220 [Lipingzhangella sp. LS1_29]|uniref:DUF3558 domain-containing protein n=1 Tax=Lipingzhangella rawalii TaxID=2055835 RepID=A0ABU2H7G9_9ACTN|nr:hypothetical protein [Lipingzhangella rawalii]MDS1271257.1 hypothetical protein [Lipingzhangella rawalii]
MTVASDTPTARRRATSRRRSFGAALGILSAVALAGGALVTTASTPQFVDTSTVPMSATTVSASPGDQDVAVDSAGARPGQPAVYGEIPACGTVGTGWLAELVPDPQLTVDTVEEVSGDAGVGERQECRWISDSLGFGDRYGYASATFVRSGHGADPESMEHLAQELRDRAGGQEASTVPDLGDAALSWYNHAEALGCAGMVTGNVLVVGCYDQQADGDSWGSLDPPEAVQAAEEAVRGLWGSLRAEGQSG